MATLPDGVRVVEQRIEDGRLLLTIDVVADRDTVCGALRGLANGAVDTFLVDEGYFPGGMKHHDHPSSTLRGAD